MYILAHTNLYLNSLKYNQFHDLYCREIFPNIFRLLCCIRVSCQAEIFFLPFPLKSLKYIQSVFHIRGVNGFLESFSADSKRQSLYNFDSIVGSSREASHSPRTLKMLKLCNDLAFSRADAQLLLEVLTYNLFISIHYVFDSTCLESEAEKSVKFSSIFFSDSHSVQWT